jgi:hypothetical protein
VQVTDISEKVVPSSAKIIKKVESGEWGVERFFRSLHKMFYLGKEIYCFALLHNFMPVVLVVGIEIAQQSNSCGDNCTPQ